MKQTGAMAEQMAWQMAVGFEDAVDVRAAKAMGPAQATREGNGTKGLIFLLLMVLLTLIPFGLRQSDYLAACWTQMKPPVFGAYVRDLSSDLRQQTGSSRGVNVCAVAKNSPAFRYDISVGDVVRSIGGLDVYDVGSFFRALDRFAGQQVVVEILRDGKRLRKEILLGAK